MTQAMPLTSTRACAGTSRGRGDFDRLTVARSLVVATGMGQTSSRKLPGRSTVPFHRPSADAILVTTGLRDCTMYGKRAIPSLLGIYYPWQIALGVAFSCHWSGPVRCIEATFRPKLANGPVSGGKDTHPREGALLCPLERYLPLPPARENLMAMTSRVSGAILCRFEPWACRRHASERFGDDCRAVANAIAN